MKKLLTMFCICILSSNLVACSNKDDIQQNENQDNEDKVSLNINKDQILFDEEIIIADDEIVEIKIKGKEKLTPGDSIGYIFSVSNETTDKIEFYVKDVTVDGNEHKTDMDENAIMPLYPNTVFSSQLTFLDIKSLDDLKNTNGVFCVKVNNEVKEYKFKIL